MQLFRCARLNVGFRSCSSAHKATYFFPDEDSWIMTRFDSEYNKKKNYNFLYDAIVLHRITEVQIEKITFPCLAL